MPNLPPNVVHLIELLAEHGALPPERARDLLRANDVVLSAELLQKLCDRFPDHLEVDKEGRVALARLRGDAGPSPSAAEAPEQWWLQLPDPEPLKLDEVVVLDIETTGLDPDNDHVWQIAVTEALTLRTTVWEVDAPDRLPPEEHRSVVPLAEALQELDRHLAGAAAVAGHRLAQFDLPFLVAAAKRVGVDWTCALDVVDVHALSLLVEPSLHARTLSDLAEVFDVRLERAHRADHDACATAELLQALVARIDGSDPSWQLARCCLTQAASALARLIPASSLPATLKGAITTKVDPLAEDGDGERFPSATAALRPSFEALAKQPSYRERRSQREMAGTVAATLDGGGRTAIEAPTGTGKSLAYLIPAAARAAQAHRPVVVATHTKVLQRQLREDAERLRALGLLPAPYRQVQGVNNYLCPREIAVAFTAGDASGTEWFAIAVALRALPVAPSGVWEDVTDGLLLRTDLGYARRRRSLVATSSTCDRKACEWIEVCPLFQRLKGLERRPGILAVNHALIAAWVEVARAGGKSPGDIFGDDPAALIFDEAHNLGDSLTSAWTESTGAIDLTILRAAAWGRFGPIRWARELSRRLELPAELFAELDRCRDELQLAEELLGDAAALYLHEYGGQEHQALLQWGVVRSRPEYRELVARSASVRSCLRHLQALLIRIDELLRDRPVPAELQKRVGGLRRRINAVFEEVSPRVEVLERLGDLADQHQFVHLLGADGEASGERGAADRWEFRRIPIEIGDRFSEEVVGRAQSVVLTSATLTVRNSFGFLADRLGLDLGPEGFDTHQVSSPFDHDAQSAVVLTAHLPAPVHTAEQEFCEDLASDLVGFLSLSGGRTLALFAARRRMELVASLIAPKVPELAERGVELLVQGQDSVGRLTSRFRENWGASLFGLRSFWEGFDAPGETLSYLVVEKPPWPHPGDLVGAARQRAVADAGGDPFLDYVVPRTAISMAQAFGRLIRTESDRGVAIICDRRLQSPSTANQTILDTLPTKTIREASDRDEAWAFALEFVTGEAPDLSQALILELNLLVAELARLQLLPGEDPDEKLRLAAKALFGLEELRHEQLVLMRAFLAGKDALGFLPTGFGKSLCFQLPALLHPSGRPAVVVSPLVALIKDQVDQLRARRGLRMVRGITGRTSAAERDETLRDLADGTVRLLYVSPERLVRDKTLSTALARQELCGLVLDEAHCVSSWGHDFRPEFRQVVQPVLALERSARMGLTATATPEVEQDITRTMELEDPTVVRLPVNRPDLRYWVSSAANDRDRTRELLRFLVHQRDRPGIVYASRRALTEELAWILRQCGTTARAYHAGMVPEQREAVQDDFLAGTTQVIVATKAFGMGINKPDIGWVVHYDLPESLEAYAQEAGRAARAAEMRGDCLLLWTKGDLQRRRRQAGRSNSDDLAIAERLLKYVQEQGMRGDNHLVDPDEAADAIGVEADRLNVLLAWLEQVGTLRRGQDASTRGAITVGRREPDELTERKLYFRWIKEYLKCRMGTRRLIELDVVAQDLDVDPDELEGTLIDWSLRRLLTFRTTRRAWRIEVISPRINEREFGRVLRSWTMLEKRRVADMIQYADGSECRRASIASAFGDPPSRCDDDALACDACSSSRPFWHDVALARVADPEALVDLPLVVLQAVRWSTWSKDGGIPAKRVSERNLVAAVRGDEGTEAAPLPTSLFRCPQFGAARYLRNSQKRVAETVARLVAEGEVTREQVNYQGRTYAALALTDRGRARLGVSRAR